MATTTLSYITTLGETQLAAALGGTKITISQAVFGSDIIISKTQTQLIALTNAVSSGNMSPVYTATGGQIQYNLIGTNQIQFRVTLGSNIGGFSIGNWGLMDSSGNLITITALSDLEVKNATSSTNAGDNRVFSITLTMDQTIIANLDLSVISLGAASLPEEPTEAALPTVATSSYPVYHVQDYNSTGYPALASRASGNWNYYLPIEELNNLFVHQGGGIGQTTSNIVYVGWDTDSTGLKATVDKTDLGYFAFQDWVKSGYLNLTNGGDITGTTTYKGSEVVNQNVLNSGLNKKVTNNAGTGGGVTQLDLASDGSGKLAYYSSGGGWQTVQPAGNYVNYTTWNSNINQDVRTTASPTFNAVSTKTIYFDNGGNSSIYQDTNSGDIVFHTNDGSDHYTVLSASGNINFPGNTFAYDVNAGFNSGWGGGTASGDNRWVNGHIGFGAPTGDSSAYAGYLQIIDRLDYGQDNGSGINMFGFDAGGARHDWYFPWNGNIVTSAGTVAFQSWVSDNFISDSTYSGDFNTGDSRILNLAYGHKILTWSVNANYGDWITFPESFSSAPTSIMTQGTVDSNRPIAIAIFNQNNSGFNFYPRRLDQDGSSNAAGGLQYYFIAIGPK